MGPLLPLMDNTRSRKTLPVLASCPAQSLHHAYPPTHGTSPGGQITKQYAAHIWWGSAGSSSSAYRASHTAADFNANYTSYLHAHP
jgi:hypothetical protein